MISLFSKLATHLLHLVTFLDQLVAKKQLRKRISWEPCVGKKCMKNGALLSMEHYIVLKNASPTAPQS